MARGEDGQYYTPLWALSPAQRYKATGGRSPNPYAGCPQDLWPEPEIQPEEEDVKETLQQLADELSPRLLAVAKPLNDMSHSELFDHFTALTDQELLTVADRGPWNASVRISLFQEIRGRWRRTLPLMKKPRSCELRGVRT